MSLPTSSQVTGIANALLRQAGVQRTVHGIEQCGSVLFGQLYQSVTGQRPSGGGESEAERCQLIVDAFSELLAPHISLNHITGCDLAARDPLTIINLLDIFSVLFHTPTVREKGGTIPPPPPLSTTDDDEELDHAQYHAPYTEVPPQLTPPPSLSITNLTCSTANQSINTHLEAEVRGRHVATPTTPPRQIQLLNSPLHHSTPRPHQTTSRRYHHLHFSSMMSSQLAESSTSATTTTPAGPSTTHSISLPLPSISPSSSTTTSFSENDEDGGNGEQEEQNDDKYGVTLTSQSESEEEEEEEIADYIPDSNSVDETVQDIQSYGGGQSSGPPDEEDVGTPKVGNIRPPHQGEEVQREEILESLYQLYLRERDRAAGQPAQQRERSKSKRGKEKRDKGNLRTGKAGVKPAGQRRSPPKHYIATKNDEQKKKNDKSIAVTSELFPLIEAGLPVCPVSMETLRQLRRKQLGQIASLTKPSSSHPPRVDQEIEAMDRKHTALLETLRKEIDHTHRLRGLEEARAQQRAVRTQLQTKRQAVARARRYYRDYELDLKAKLQKKRTNEEMVFRHVFEEALGLVREREREVRRLEKEKKEIQTERLRKELRAMDQYYSDQLSMLAASLAEEREKKAVRETAKTRMAQQMRRELREKLEREVRQLQSCLDRDDDVTHFRELDAQQLRLALHHLLTPY